jgi:hypothetical protein
LDIYGNKINCSSSIAGCFHSDSVQKVSHRYNDNIFQILSCHALWWIYQWFMVCRSQIEMFLDKNIKHNCWTLLWLMEINGQRHMWRVISLHAVPRSIPSNMYLFYILLYKQHWQAWQTTFWTWNWHCYIWNRFQLNNCEIQISLKKSDWHRGNFVLACILLL